jgi:hypothetical protein
MEETTRYSNHSSHSKSRHSSLSHDFDDEIDGLPMTEEEYEAIMNESSSEEDFPDHHDIEMEKKSLVDGDLKPLVAEYLDTV